MRNILVVILLAFALTGCSSIQSALHPSTPSPVLDAQKTAEQVIYGFEAAFQATPDIVSALMKNGLVTPHDYNTRILPAYNRGLVSLNVVVDALRSCEDAHQDPNQVTAYTSALASFLTDKANIDNMLTAFGKGAAQ